MTDKQILKKVIEWLKANTKEKYLVEELRLDSARLLTMIIELKEKN